MKFIAFVLLTAGLLKCGDGSGDDCIAPECSQQAVVVNLTGLDGCGLVLELNDGTRLIPERRVYIQAPDPKDDPIYHFDLVAGDSVRFDYVESDAASACMAGEVVFVTCIESINHKEE